MGAANWMEARNLKILFCVKDKDHSPRLKMKGHLKGAKGSKQGRQGRSKTMPAFKGTNTRTDGEKT